MDKVYIVYWTQGGNTKAMAEAIGEGVSEVGKEAVICTPSEVNVADLRDLPAFAMGCPAMGAEELEEAEMEPFVSEVEGFISGKSVALFGSYGWGDGQWMRDWVDRTNNAGATVIGGEGIIAQDYPSESDLAKCKEIGRKLAEI